MRVVLLLPACLALAACAVAPSRPIRVPATYDVRRAALQSVLHFSLEGRLAAAVGQEGSNASLIWKQNGRRSDLTFRAPLGFGTAQVMRDGDEVQLKSSRGERYSGPVATEALARRLGFEPPLDSLRYWVLGVPDPARPAIETPGAEQRLTALEQDGWHVEYAEYRSFGAKPLEAVLPRRVNLTREGIRVRLIVDHWAVQSP
jgi:outer membrane lipoprotein LolB